MDAVRYILFLAFLQVVRSSGGHFEVPEPTIEVFAPKGLRISIQDAKSVEEVEFIVTVPGVSEPLIHRTHKPDRGRWAYWNPDVAVHLYEKIRYKIVVKYLGLFCQREGVHVVEKIVGFNDTDCEENGQGQKVVPGFSNFDDFDRRVGTFASGKSSNFQSSYSMYKNAGLKPITKSSTSTTSGTFYLKPSGALEGRGYKSGSTFDSTKNEGEQWQHYRSELTAEELEEIRKSGLRVLDLPGNFFPGGIKTYDQSYLASEFRNFPGSLNRVGMGDGEVKTQFHETHETHESSYNSHSNPNVRFQFQDMSRGNTLSAGEKSESSYRVESANQVSNGQPQTGAFFKSKEYHREEHSVPGTRVHVTREPSAATQKVVQVSHTKEYSSRSHGETQPVSTVHESHRDYNQREFTRQDQTSRAYDGSIFKYYKSSQPRYPDECVMIPGTDYPPSENIRQLEKLYYELSCLSSVAETNHKKEINALKQQNYELSRKIQTLERIVERL